MTDQAENTPPADNKTPPADNAKKDDVKPDNGNQPDPAAPGAKQPAAAVNAELYKPEGLADHFLGKDDRETIDKLLKGYTGFREAAAKKGVPESPDGYTLNLPDEIKSKVIKPGEDGKDPVFEELKPIFHKHQAPNALVQELTEKFYSKVAEIASTADKNPDGTPLADFEFKELGGMEKVKPQIEGAEVWIKGLVQSGKFTEKEGKELSLMTTYSEGLSLLMKMRAAMGEKPIPKDLGGNHQEGITKAMLDSRVSDPRYWSDQAFHEETTQMFKKFYAA